MPYEMMVGLQVTDAEKYQDYRAGMKPILAQYGGGFRYDFWIQETLASETTNPINRVFAIYFADQKSSEAFFSHPEYLKVKAAFFESSVEATTILASYTR